MSLRGHKTMESCRDDVRAITLEEQQVHQVSQAIVIGFPVSRLNFMYTYTDVQKKRFTKKKKEKKKKEKKVAQLATCTSYKCGSVVYLSFDCDILTY